MKLNSDPSPTKVYTNFNYCYIQKMIIYLVRFSIESLIKTYFLNLSVVKKQSSSSTI
jgi:hypothetical protein